MTALAARVLAELGRLRLVGAGDRVVVGLSGGPDSVALTRVLADGLPRLEVALVGVAHLHHGLRGTDADEDESFCRTLAGTLGVECMVERADAAAHAREAGVSVEVAGHRLRAQLFSRARARFGARVVATGHTKNDLAETFLMRAARGAGLRGLGGIRPSAPGLIRPLLSVTRAEILDYLVTIGQLFREDASNQDLGVPRNRVRHLAIPWLEANLSPGLVDALARAATVAAEDDRFLRRVATRLAARVVLSAGGATSVDIGGLQRMPVALRRRVMLDVLDDVSGGRTTLGAVDTVLGLVDRTDLVTVAVGGGLRVRRTADRIVVEPGQGRREPNRSRLSGRPVGVLPVPGVLDLSGGQAIEVHRLASVEVAVDVRPPSGLEATLDADHVCEPLTVRFRQMGDRVRPLGMAGRKKLQDVFVDLKVPRDQRDDVPLVVDAAGRILWVAGYVVGHEARVTSATTSVLLLKYRR